MLMLVFLIYLNTPELPVPEVMPIYKLSILLCRKDVKKRSFVVRCADISNSIPAEAVASDNVETIKVQLDRFLGIGYMKFQNSVETTLVVSHSKRRSLHCKCVNSL